MRCGAVMSYYLEKAEDKIYRILGRAFLKNPNGIGRLVMLKKDIHLCKVRGLYSYCKENDGIIEMVEANEYHLCRKPAQTETEFEQDKEFEQRKGFKIYTSRIYNAIVAGGMDAVIKDGDYLTDRMEWDKNGVMMHLPDCVKAADGKECLIKYDLKKLKHIPRGINLIKMWGVNYFHFTFEVISRMQYIDSIPEYKDYPLIMDEEVFQDKKNEELLKWINTDKHPIIKINRRQLYLVEELIIPAVHAWSMHDFEEQRKGYGWLLDSRCALYMRKKILKDFTPQKVFSKVYVTRGDNKRLLNEQEVADYLEKRGFEVVNPDNMSLQEEIDCFATADCIVGVTGAAFTNVIYCKESAKVIQICPFAYQFAGGAAIADSYGANWKYISADVYQAGKTMNQSRFVLSDNKFQCLIESAL